MSKLFSNVTLIYFQAGAMRGGGLLEKMSSDPSSYMLAVLLLSYTSFVNSGEKFKIKICMLCGINDNIVKFKYVNLQYSLIILG